MEIWHKTRAQPTEEQPTQALVSICSSPSASRPNRVRSFFENAFAVACLSSSPAIAAFCCEEDDLYIVVYAGRNTAGLDPSQTQAASAGGGGCFVYDARLRFLCRFSPCDCEVSGTTCAASSGWGS